jgi:hypothetical protein
MVFMQEATGFCGTMPSHLLTTRGAKAVAYGDLDSDGNMDLVFANSFWAGFAVVDSYIYWGRAGGGFDPTPTGLPTSGAEDVKVADLDGDTDLDLVFANGLDNALNRRVDSFVYMNDGSGGFPGAPDWGLPTVGVSAVVLPTVGASDVVAETLIDPGSGGYLSTVIRPEDPSDTGTFHTFDYTATLTGSKAAKVRILDSETWEVLAETDLMSGKNMWDLVDSFNVKDHPSVRVLIAVDGLDRPGEVTIDDLSLNWTKRIRLPPMVLDMVVSEPSVLRTRTVAISINVSDEYDAPEDLRLTVEHSVNGSNEWSSDLVRPLSFKDGTWTSTVVPAHDADLGSYDFRVRARDTDTLLSEYLVVPNVLEVLNNIPTAPEVRVDPGRPLTTSTLKAELTVAATDVDSIALTYHFKWYRDGELVENLTTGMVAPQHTSRGENWSVEARAFDGVDEGPPAFAWRRIENAPPIPKEPLPDPEILEDSVDSEWLDLSTAFEDPDGDPITWDLATVPIHMTVEIDPSTGRVTLIPDENWWGIENLTFIASDGELQGSQSVTVNVLPVNDVPIVATINGMPVTSDTITLSIGQGERMVIDYLVVDVEGNEVQASVNTSAVTLDEANQRITFDPDNDAVGTLRFALKVWDTVSVDEKSVVNFIIVVENKNDPMDVPIITSPVTGSKYEVNQSFSLVAICDDPDIQYGQVLNYTWTSNISGLLGYGSSLVLSISEPGTHLINLTVRDPDFEMSATIEIVIEGAEPVIPPPPPPDDDDEEPGPNWVLIVGIIAILGILGAVLFVIVSKRRTEAYEVEVDTEMEAEERRRTLERAREAIKDLADEWETGDEEWAETPDGQEELGTATPPTQPSIEPAATETPSEDIASQWEDMTEVAEVPEVDPEELRISNLKRKYQNAIGHLPYGIPSPELKGRDWVSLAAALATGKKRTTPEGHELTEIDGRWYHSDPEDSGTFLKEHGARRTVDDGRSAKVEVTTDREQLLSKLEERMIMGEISEESYKDLKRKLGG